MASTSSPIGAIPPRSRSRHSRLAADPASARRVHAEDDRGPRGPRDAFQRDRDRIIHSVAFRRLRHKTQVFVAPDGDHYRVRLTHSLEVAQIGRAMARALGLNEDLTEALCLAHDLGHPPFGHGGEDALDRKLETAGGFDHNGHSLRIVTLLEAPYPGFDGLNLSDATLDGLAKHNGPVANPEWAMAEAANANGIDLSGWPSLEAQVAAIADDIAYDNHDIDDGLRAGILDLDTLLGLPMVGEHWEAIEARHPGLDADRKQCALVRDQIGTMVGDVLDETRRRIDSAGVETADDVRAHDAPLVGFSSDMAANERALKKHMYKHLYDSAALRPIRRKAQEIVGNLASAFIEGDAPLPDGWQRHDDERGRLRGIGDYIAGMTDPFAISAHEKLVGPASLPKDRF
ncbi:deoxyguanosinetriphosphate triphosphohydrolase [Sphingomicrobium clamense]|uniref:Deoxyguanosinetriphosphate triphosphohydrolase-like protein n=1 Tax=Sphingomicrobium clamense TaxID=2851013 RepID=A0ABS6V4D9_9SPHN|nr:deoxyguanosinetriphosphate triphosphohydrolase [Sphingomicrobium sp. B8]MBW0144409.1 deoxyguanosinetriphosphate triphosphohydrolase [Sphingomicrobium sp. B8]